MRMYEFKTLGVSGRKEHMNTRTHIRTNIRFQSFGSRVDWQANELTANKKRNMQTYTERHSRQSIRFGKGIRRRMYVCMYVAYVCMN